MSTKHNFILSLLSVILTITLCGCMEEQKGTSDSGWIDLFNGKNLDGWTPKITGQKFGEDPDGIFSVKDGKIVVSYADDAKFTGQFGHLFYKDSFSHYRLAIK